MLLSISIGGATGAFVGTDTTFVGNWLAPYVGVYDNMSDIRGMFNAGLSTFGGFAAFQTFQNLTFKKGKNWID